MTGHHLVACLLLLALFVSLATSQITFSRTWVRGKYPGEEDGLVPEGEGPAFLRASKAADDPMRPFTRTAKSDLGLNTRAFEDFYRRWKSPYFNRYKEVIVPLNSE